jgi:hypothetical protein
MHFARVTLIVIFATALAAFGTCVVVQQRPGHTHGEEVQREAGGGLQRHALDCWTPRR